MTDETPPKIRGKKEREAAYRQGFADGLAHAKAETAAQRALEAERDEAMRDGLAKLQARPVVRRRHRKQADVRTQEQLLRDIAARQVAEG